MIPTGQTAVLLAAAGGWLDLLFYGTCLAVALLVAAAGHRAGPPLARKGETIALGQRPTRPLPGIVQTRRDQPGGIRPPPAPSSAASSRRAPSRAAPPPAPKPNAGRRPARPPTASGPNDPAKVLADLSAAP